MGLPATIGRYEILEEIGRGSMGVVYKARDPRIGRVVALKTIAFSFPLSAEEEKEFLQRFYHEAQVAGRLNHPNIVTIHDVGEKGPEGEAYIAMEHVTGANLHDLLAGGGRLPMQQVAEVIERLAGALDYAHQNGVVHRDIKPANVLLADGMQPKILDFGIARLAAGGLTRPGKFFGTPNYMAPEQVTGIDVDGRADQFSLGVILYQLLTGEKPFAGDSVTAISYQVVNVDPPAPSKLNPSLRPAFDRIIRKVLSKHASDRYATCQELADDLKTAVADWLAASDQAIPPTLVSGAAAAARAETRERGVRGITFLAPRWSQMLAHTGSPLGIGWMVFLLCLGLLASAPFLMHRGRPAAAGGSRPAGLLTGPLAGDDRLAGLTTAPPADPARQARLKLNLQSRVAAGRIEVRLDGVPVLEERFKASGSRKRWARELQVLPGRRRIEVRVVSSDKSYDQVAGIDATFKAREVKDLAISMSGLSKRLRLRFTGPAEGGVSR
jgi:serine/threonine-protein kinase